MDQSQEILLGHAMVTIILHVRLAVKYTFVVCILRAIVTLCDDSCFSDVHWICNCLGIYGMNLVRVECIYACTYVSKK